MPAPIQSGLFPMNYPDNRGQKMVRCGEARRGPTCLSRRTANLARGPAQVMAGTRVGEISRSQTPASLTNGEALLPSERHEPPSYSNGRRLDHQYGGVLVT